MLVELQLRAEPILARLRQRFASMNVCHTEGFTLLGKPAVLDRIELGATELTSVGGGPAMTIQKHGGGKESVPAKRARIEQAITLHAATLEELEKANGQPPKTTAAQVTLRFDMIVDAVKDLARMRIEYAGTDLGIISSQLAPQDAAKVEAKLATLLPTEVRFLDLDAIEGVVGHPVDVLNAGLAADASGQRIAIRLEIDAADQGNVAAWTSFLGGDVEDHLGERDWAMLVDHRLLVPRVVQGFKDGLAKSSEFSVDSWPQGSWSPSGSTPRIVVSFSGEVVDACPVYLGVWVHWQDVDVDVDAHVSLHASAPNEMETRIRLFWDLNDWEVAACAISGALMWPVIGTALLAEEKINWGEFFAGFLITAIGRFVAAIVAANEQQPPASAIQAGGQCSKVETDADMEIRCKQPMSAGANPLVGALTFQAVHAHSKGPVFSGSVSPVQEAPQPVIALEAQGFDWENIGDPCGVSYVGALATIDLRNTGGGSPKVCKVSILDPAPSTAANEGDPAWIMRNHLKWTPSGSGPGWMLGTASVEIPLDAPELSAYLQNPYPLKVLIQTSAGARVVTLPPFQAITEEEKQQLELQRMTAIVHCKIMSLKWKDRAPFPPRWKVDPCPEDALHLWQVVAADLRHDEVLQILDARGQVLAQALPDRRGLAEASVLVEPAHDGHDVTLARVGKPPVAQTPAPHAHEHAAARATATARPAEHPTHGHAGHHGKAPEVDFPLHVRQGLVVRRATLALGSRVRRLLAGRLGGAPALFCVTERGLQVYDLTSPAHPCLAHVERLPGLRGGLASREGIVVWGDAGMRLPRGAVLPLSEGDVRDVRHLLPGVDVVDAVEVHGRIFALAADGLTSHGDDLSALGSARIEGGRALARVGAALVVADRAGLATFAPEAPDGPALLGRLDLPGVVALSTAMLPHGHVLATLEDGGAIVVEVARGEAPASRTRYAAAPWFAGTERVGPLLARLDPSGIQIDLFECPRSAEGLLADPFGTRAKRRKTAERDRAPKEKAEPTHEEPRSVPVEEDEERPRKRAAKAKQ